MGKLTGMMFAALAALFAVVATPASAQATRTWVSGVGDDANPCSRTAPCKTFAGSISKTAAGGEINCLDPGGFGAVTITKSITIRCNATEGGVLVGGTNGININAATTDTIILDGLDIYGVSGALNGIRVTQAGNVVVRNTLITGFNTSGSSGILLNSTSKVILVMEDCTITNNDVGVNLAVSAGNMRARVYDSLLTGNTTAGISVNGTGNRVEISGSQITNSAKSIALTAGGIAFSYGDNVLSAGDAPTVIPKG